MDEMLMMDRRRRAAWRDGVLHAEEDALAFTSIRRPRRGAHRVGSKVPLMPALLTRTSSLPKASTVALTAFSHSASL